MKSIQKAFTHLSRIVLWLFSIPLLLSAGCQQMQPFLLDTPPDDNGELRLVGRMGGPVLAVAATSSHAFLGHSFEFAVIDVRDPAAYHRVAYLALSANDIAVAGNLAYVAGRAGLTIVDVTVPEEPTPIGFLATSKPLADVVLAGQIAYVSSPTGGLTVVDIGDPTAPRSLGSLNPRARIEDLALAGDRVLLATSMGLGVVRRTADGGPIIEGAYSFGTRLEAVVAQGSTVYVAPGNGVLMVVDMADTENPRVVTALEVGGYISKLLIHDERLYVAGNRNGMTVMDISDPTQPVVSGLIDPGGQATDLFVADGQMFVAVFDRGGFYTVPIDLGNSFTLSGRYESVGWAIAVALDGDRAYVMSGEQGGLTELDVTVPEQPAVITCTRLGTTPLDIAVDAGRLYLAAGAKGVEIVDYTQSPPARTQCPFAPALDTRVLAIDPPMAYLLGEQGTLHVVDCQNGTRFGAVHVPGDVSDMAVEAGFGVLAVGVNGVRMVNLQDPTHPVLGPALELPGFTHAVALVDGMAYAAVNGSGLHIVDLTDPIAPRIAGSFLLENSIASIVVKDESVLIAVGPGGLCLIDVSDPTRPVEVELRATPDSVIDVAVSDNTVIVADGMGGLLVFELEER